MSILQMEKLILIYKFSLVYTNEDGVYEDKEKCIFYQRRIAQVKL